MAQNTRVEGLQLLKNRTKVLKMVLEREHKYRVLVTVLLEEFVNKLPDSWFSQPKSKKYALLGFQGIKKCLQQILEAHAPLEARFQQVRRRLCCLWYESCGKSCTSPCAMCCVQALRAVYGVLCTVCCVICAV